MMYRGRKGTRGTRGGGGTERNPLQDEVLRILPRSDHYFLDERPQLPRFSGHLRIYCSDEDSS